MACARPGHTCCSCSSSLRLRDTLKPFGPSAMFRKSVIKGLLSCGGTGTSMSAVRGAFPASRPLYLGDYTHSVDCSATLTPVTRRLCLQRESFCSGAPLDLGQVLDGKTAGLNPYLVPQAAGSDGNHTLN